MPVRLSAAFGKTSSACEELIAEFVLVVVDQRTLKLQIVMMEREKETRTS